MTFTSWEYGSSLAHFEIQGMKWGQRRFQNEDGSLTAAGQRRYGVDGKRGALGRSMDLNKLDREYTQASYKASRYRERAADRYSRQNYRNKKRNPGSRNIAKDDKVKKFEKLAADYEKLANKSKAMSDRIIKNSLKKGMSIHSKDTLREVNVGRNIAKSIGISMVAPVVYSESTFAKGTHYRVKNDGRRQRTHRTRSRVSRNVGTNRTAFSAGRYW